MNGKQKKAMRDGYQTLIKLLQEHRMMECDLKVEIDREKKDREKQR